MSPGGSDIGLRDTFVASTSRAGHVLAGQKLTEACGARFNYYSLVCYMYALKHARLVRDKTDAEVFGFYMDIRAVKAENTNLGIPAQIYESMSLKIRS